jgi:hypothetical protein
MNSSGLQPGEKKKGEKPSASKRFLDDTLFSDEIALVLKK